jgi:hypothetical protein
MPIPGSVLTSRFPFGITAAADVYPSLCTLRPVTKSTDTTGQVTKTFADSTTYKDMSCRISPLILVRPQQQEFDRVGVQQVDARFQVTVNQYLPIASEVLDEYQIKVDGFVYQIKSSEYDGERLSHRLMVNTVIPFAE